MVSVTTQQDIDIDVDVLIVGAGISGLGAAYRLHERNPRLTYIIVERRAQIGGTWDLFRYPGVRSDSSMFTLSFPWEPWTRREGVADAEHIRDYMTATAHKHGIDRHIRFDSHVRSADWDSATDTWTVTVEHDGARRLYRSRFLFFGSGYYNYDEGYTPDFPGIEQFGGTVIHPQHWPEAPRLCRQEDRGDRQRRHRDHPDPSAGRAGRKSDHAAALADLHRLGVQVRQGCRGVS